MAQGTSPAGIASLIDALAGSGPILVPTMLVVAHPDDETLILAGQLPRFADLTIVHATDGAPRDGADARRHGFTTPQAYARARRRELEAAMALAGMAPQALVGLGLPDQGAPFALPHLVGRLGDLVAARRPAAIVTHAYEGGHPDHDAVAFAVHAAARPFGLEIVEAPLYRRGADGWAMQSFPDEDGTAVALSPAAQDLKRRMLAAHESQAGTLAGFGLAREVFRAAPEHDFEALPNRGRLLYEEHPWGLDGGRWLDLVRAARAELR
jgi:N-acetylglucosamine malate deacetylase 2